MNKYLLKIFNRVLGPVVDQSIKRLEKERINRYQRMVTSNPTTLFRDGFKVRNRQNDPTQIVIGAHCVVQAELLIMGYGGRISIGDYCYLGENSRVWSGKSVSIGRYALISHNVNIIDTNSHQIDHEQRARAYMDLLKHGPSKESHGVSCDDIVVEDYAWINFNSTILKGTTIGKGAIIGPNSVVINDVPPFTFYAGNPAVFIRKI